MDYAHFSVGLTGGIGSGKTFVSDMFAMLGATVVDADVVSRNLTAINGEGIEPIRQIFGAEFITQEGALDRVKMRQHVFNNPQARHQLEGILHPLIRDICFDQAAKAQGDYVIFVNPLLLELPIWQGMGTRILVVDCPEDLQIQRVVKRSGLTVDQVKAIIAAQATRKQRLAKADDVITNDQDANVIEQKVRPLHRIYQQLAKDVS